MPVLDKDVLYVARCFFNTVPARTSYELSSRVLDDLERRYREGGRSYHTIAHIASTLRYVEAHGGNLSKKERTCVTLSLLFHDAVYKIGTGKGALSNEEESARLAQGALFDLGFSKKVIDETVRLILLTEEHIVAEGDHVGALMLDADLAILGAGESEYDDYVAGVREEYGVFDDQTWARGRAGVLINMLAEGSIYSGEYGKANLEDAARANIERELAGLDGVLGNH